MNWPVSVEPDSLLPVCGPPRIHEPTPKLAHQSHELDYKFKFGSFLF